MSYDLNSQLAQAANDALEAGDADAAESPEGDYVGEISFLRGVPRTATLRARTPTELYVLRRLDFDQLLARLDGGALAPHADLMTQIEATAQARLDDTAARLAVRSA